MYFRDFATSIWHLIVHFVKSHFEGNEWISCWQRQNIREEIIFVANRCLLYFLFLSKRKLIWEKRTFYICLKLNLIVAFFSWRLSTKHKMKIMMPTARHQPNLDFEADCEKRSIFCLQFGRLALAGWLGERHFHTQSFKLWEITHGAGFKSFKTGPGQSVLFWDVLSWDWVFGDFGSTYRYSRCRSHARRLRHSGISVESKVFFIAFCSIQYFEIS